MKIRTIEGKISLVINQIALRNDVHIECYLERENIEIQVDLEPSEGQVPLG